LQQVIRSTAPNIDAMKGQHFTDIQLITLQTLIDTLIPPDEWPSGWESGVGDYLLRQFDRDLRDRLEIYRTALDLLDAETTMTSHAHVAFADLSLPERTELLTQLEQGSTSNQWPFAPSEFISMASAHAAEGFYSDPGNGGNRGGIAWKMMGFEVRG
jgi:hypothetical protein